jgi:hypothetical protein
MELHGIGGVDAPMRLHLSLTLLVAGCRAMPGGECFDDWFMECDSGGTQIAICIDHHWVFEACRGPKGCKDDGAVVCDRSAAKEGDSCRHDDETCSLDHQRVLRCENHRRVVDRSCPGPKGCEQRIGRSGLSEVTCDRILLAEIGDACKCGQIAQTNGDHEMLYCFYGTFDVTGFSHRDWSCVGECTRRIPSCDHTARAGLECNTVLEQGAWCSNDFGSELRCIDGVFTRVRDCPHGCEVKAGVLACD